MLGFRVQGLGYRAYLVQLTCPRWALYLLLSYLFFFKGIVYSRRGLGFEGVVQV